MDKSEVSQYEQNLWKMVFEKYLTKPVLIGASAEAIVKEAAKLATDAVKLYRAFLDEKS